MQTLAVVAAKLKKSLKLSLMSVLRLLVHVVEWAEFNKYYFTWDGLQHGHRRYHVLEHSLYG